MGRLGRSRPGRPPRSLGVPGHPSGTRGRAGLPSVRSGRRRARLSRPARTDADVPFGGALPCAMPGMRLDSFVHSHRTRPPGRGGEISPAGPSSLFILHGPGGVAPLWSATRRAAPATAPPGRPSRCRRGPDRASRAELGRGSSRRIQLTGVYIDATRAETRRLSIGLRNERLESRNGKRIAFEVETGKSDAAGNVRKCLDAGIMEVVVVGTSEESRRTLERRRQGCPGMRVYTPEEALRGFAGRGNKWKSGPWSCKVKRGSPPRFGRLGAL